MFTPRPTDTYPTSTFPSNISKFHVSHWMHFISYIFSGFQLIINFNKFLRKWRWNRSIIKWTCSKEMNIRCINFQHHFPYILGSSGFFLSKEKCSTKNSFCTKCKCCIKCSSICYSSICNNRYLYRINNEWNNRKSSNIMTWKSTSFIHSCCNNDICSSLFCFSR